MNAAAPMDEDRLKLVAVPSAEEIAVLMVDRALTAWGLCSCLPEMERAVRRLVGESLRVVPDGATIGVRVVLMADVVVVEVIDAALTYPTAEPELPSPRAEALHGMSWLHGSDGRLCGRCSWYATGIDGARTAVPERGEVVRYGLHAR